MTSDGRTTLGCRRDRRGNTRSRVRRPCTTPRSAAISTDPLISPPCAHLLVGRRPLNCLSDCPAHYRVPVLSRLLAAETVLRSQTLPPITAAYDRKMKMGCAECGCVIESSVRIVICSDGCCCRDVPVSGQATRVPQLSDGGIEPDGTRAELEQARVTFHALVQSAGEEELGQRSNCQWPSYGPR